MAIDPLTIGLIAGGSSLLSSVTGFFGQKDEAREQNKQIIAQYKQRMKIQQAQDLARFGKYNAKVLGYEQGIANLTEQARLETQQDQLRMDQLLKGMAFQDQSAAVNERTDRGKVAARGTAGASMLAAQQSVSAAIGRQAAARDEQLVGAVLANELREDARIRSLNAAREKQFNSVRYAPERSRQMDRPELLSGPSPYSLISGIGQAALSGVSAGIGQQNFLDQIASQNPTQVQVPQ